MESGRATTFTVVLSARPAADVTIEISSNDEVAGTVSPASLAFKSLIWDMPRKIIITGIDDLEQDVTREYEIIIDSFVTL